MSTSPAPATIFRMLKNMQKEITRLQRANQQGPPPSVVALVHEYVQAVAANPWVITHGLGRKPAGVVVLDTFGNEIQPEDVIITDTHITASFLGARPGTLLYV
jgi:hypothetical protein